MDEPQCQSSTPPEIPASVRRRQPLHSISTRLIFFGFLSTFLTALFVSWIAIDAIQEHLLREARTHLSALAERRLDEIETGLSGALEQLERAAADGDWASAVRRSSKTGLKTRLDSLLEDSAGLFESVAVLDGQASLVAVSGERVGRLSPLGVEAAGAELESRAARLLALRDEDGGVRLLVTAPIPPHRVDSATRGNRLIGLLERAPLQQLLAPARSRPGAGLRIVDARGRTLLAAPDAQSDDPPAPLQDILRAGAGTVSAYEGRSGRALACAHPLRHGDWALLAESGVDDILTQALSSARRILLGDLFVILLFSLLAYRITSTVVQPIEALSEGAVRISQGDIEHEIPLPRAHDEIGFLTQAFNDMMGKLRRSQLEIEQDKIRLAEHNEDLQRVNEVLSQLSITDGLTKLHNHRYFQDHLTREIKRTSRTGEALSMILVDLDDFKRLNDRYGHAAGDEMLMSIASLMNSSVRESDLLARYGGEEFVILAPGTDLEAAVTLAEKLRMAAEDSSQIIDDSMRPVRVTISCGVAQYRGDRKRFFLAADRALYRAKESGKNCVMSAEDEDPEDFASTS